MSNFQFYNTSEDEIKRLKDDLYFARSTIVRLMPDNIRAVLENHWSCETREQTYVWANNASDEIIEAAKILSREEGS